MSEKFDIRREKDPSPRVRREAEVSKLTTLLKQNKTRLEIRTVRR